MKEEKEKEKEELEREQEKVKEKLKEVLEREVEKEMRKELQEKKRRGMAEIPAAHEVIPSTEDSSIGGWRFYLYLSGILVGVSYFASALLILHAKPFKT